MTKKVIKKAIVKRYRCDEPMARKKDILQLCDKRCSVCMAAIAVLSSGEEKHVPIDDERGYFDPKVKMQHIVGR